MTKGIRSCCFALALAAALLPRVAAAQTCTYQHINVNASELTSVEALDTYDYCYTIPFTGTLRGTLFSCFRQADLFPSYVLWGDGNMLVARWYDELRTPDGTVTVTERGMWDYGYAGATGAQATLMEITGGTGRYTGASGLLMGIGGVFPRAARSNNPQVTADGQLLGVLCTP